MLGNINKAKIKMVAKRDLLLIIILRGRRRKKTLRYGCDRSTKKAVFF